MGGLVKYICFGAVETPGAPDGTVGDPAAADLPQMAQESEQPRGRSQKPDSVQPVEKNNP